MRISRIIMGALYIAAGAMHFIATPKYVHIMPAYLPHPRALVLISGAAELAGGLGVLIPTTRRSAAWGIICLLVAVMPANIWMAQHPGLTPGVPRWLLIFRLPLQLPLIGWAFLYTRPESHDATTSASSRSTHQ